MNISSLQLSLSTEELDITVGGIAQFHANFSNISKIDYLYNLTVQLVLPAGVILASSDLEPNSQSTNSITGRTTYTWISIKDLAPNEIDYSMRFEIGVLNQYPGTTIDIPFDTIFDNIELNAQADTMPRGNYDSGNQVKSTNSTMIVQAVRFYFRLIVPGKMLKGAGTSSSSSSATTVYQYTLKWIGNSRESSTFDFTLHLPNGIRYLGNLVVNGVTLTGSDVPVVELPGPIPGEEGTYRNATTLQWTNAQLAAGETKIIQFQGALYDNNTTLGIENAGTQIPHRATLQYSALMQNDFATVKEFETSTAMEIIIEKRMNRTSGNIDVGDEVTYTLTYKVGEYSAIDSVEITDVLGDGHTLNSVSMSYTPSVVDGNQVILMLLGNLLATTTGSITMRTTIASTYDNREDVVAGDYLSNEATIDGQLLGKTVSDQARLRFRLRRPMITKQIIAIYHADGTLSTSQYPTQGDRVRFRISYDASNLTAKQKGIIIYEYPPYYMFPLVGNTSFVYTTNRPELSSLIPVVEPNHGLSWRLGLLTGGTTWAVTFDLFINEVSINEFHQNLVKLQGTYRGNYTYSERNFVPIHIGNPNLQITKDVAGNNPNAIKANETYTYTLTISNVDILGAYGTDAYYVKVIDTLPATLTHTGIPSLSGIATPGTATWDAETLTWIIPKLALGETATLSFEVIVYAGLGSGEQICNTAQITEAFSQEGKGYEYTNLTPLSAQKCMEALPVTISTTATPTPARIGETISYTTTITVPQGTTAYDLRLTESVPSVKQTFNSSSVTLGGVTVTPSITSGTMSLPLLPTVVASTTDTQLIYAFTTNVISGNTSSLLTLKENQTMTSVVSWDKSASAATVSTATTSVIVDVQSPRLALTLSQRNVTKNTSFTTSNLNSYDIGDVIEYRLVLANTGLQPAYDINVEHLLRNFTSYVSGTSTITAGTFTLRSNSANWSLESLNAGSSQQFTFQVTTLPGIAPNDRISTLMTASNYTFPNSEGVFLNPIQSNTVNMFAPNITITLTSAPTTVEVGDTLTHTVVVTYPIGTISTGVELRLNMIAQQTFLQGVTNTTTGATYANMPIGNVVTISLPNMDATSGVVTNTFVYNTRVTSVTHVSPYSEQQRLSARMKWNVTEDITTARTRTANGNLVTVRMPFISVSGTQIKGTSLYSANAIVAIPMSVVRQRMIFTSNGASEAFTMQGIVTTPTQTTLQNVVVTTTSSTPPSHSISRNIITFTKELLNVGKTVTIDYELVVPEGLSPGQTFLTTSSVQYNSNDIHPVTYTGTGNNLSVQMQDVTFSRVAPSSAVTGDIVRPTLTVTVPQGTVLNNLVLKQVYPATHHRIGNYEINNVAVTPTVTGNTIIFPTQTTVNAMNKPVSIQYEYSTLVKMISPTATGTEVQTYTTVLEWTDENGKAYSRTYTNPLSVTQPYIMFEYGQSNPTYEMEPTTNSIYGAHGNDIIYTMIGTNQGLAPAESVIIQKVINDQISYVSYTAATIQPTSFVQSGKELTFTFKNVAPSETINLLVTTVIPETSVGGNIFANTMTEKTYSSSTTPYLLVETVNLPLTGTVSYRISIDGTYYYLNESVITGEELREIGHVGRDYALYYDSSDGQDIKIRRTTIWTVQDGQMFYTAPVIILPG